MKKNLKRMLSLALCLLLCLGLSAPAFADGWMQDGWGWWYQEGSSYASNGWRLIDGSWYYFDANGYMVTGWLYDGAWYYLKADGSMAADEWVDGYYVNASGVWVQSGWQYDGWGWWYRNEDGSYPAACWKDIGGERYYFDASGYMVTGWLKYESSWYYLNPDGSMAIGQIDLDGQLYYMGLDGAMRTGFFYDDDGGYLRYAYPDGHLARKEYVPYITGEPMYFDEDGYVAEGPTDEPEPTDPDTPSDGSLTGDSALNRENILAVLDSYDPDGAYIVRNSSESGLLAWFNNAATLAEGLDSMGTAVHEQCHDFTFGGSWNSEQIYIGNGGYMDLPYTQTYPSQEMAAEIPESLRTFRYDTYVAGDYDMASNKEGVYGLMNEFTAYYWGFVDDCRMENYAEDYDISYRNSSNTYIAYAEFRYFILSYMLYAKEHYPDIYNDTLANADLRVAYSTIESLFAAKVAEYRGSHSLYSGFENEYNALMTEMQKSEYVEMQALMQP